MTQNIQITTRDQKGNVYSSLLNWNQTIQLDFCSKLCLTNWWISISNKVKQEILIITACIPKSLTVLISGGSVVENIDAIQATNEDKDFHSLGKLIRESIEKNEPEAALDRLHTYTVKFLKKLCDLHKITFTKDETVNALFGKYIKSIREKGFLESAMAEKIVQFSFQIMDDFNEIRNNRSYAHDNQILNYDESVLIFSNISSMVKFIQAMEAKNKNKEVEEADLDWGQF